MSVQIRVDQAAHSAGVTGRAREDLATGSPVTLTAVGGPYLAYLWSIAWKPIDIVGATRSAAALSAATSPATLVTPIDLPGTYRATVAVDSGNGLGAGEEDNASITFYAGPTLNTNPAKFPRRQPAVGETTEHNVPDGIDPSGNVDGWARERAKWDLIAQQAFNATGSVVSVALFSGIASTSNDSGIPLRVADRKIDRAKLMLLSSASLVKLVVGLETSDGTAAAHVDLIDVDGVAVGGGGPGTTVPSSGLSTSSTSPVEVVATLTAALATAAAGRFRLRLWSATAGKFVTCSYAYFELS